MAASGGYKEIPSFWCPSSKVNSGKRTNKSSGNGRVRNIHLVISKCWDKIKYIKEGEFYIPYESCSKHQNGYGDDCGCLRWVEEIEKHIDNIQKQLDIIKKEIK